MNVEEAAAVVVIVGAIGAALVKIISALGQIHLLVNSRLTKALQMIAALSQEKANSTGKPSDQVRADNALLESQGGAPATASVRPDPVVKENP